MKRLLIAIIGLSAAAFVQADTECEDAVDMADSLDFHAMHVECSKDPVTLYDPESKSSFLSKKGKVVTAYADQTGSPAATSAAPKSAAVISSRSAANPVVETEMADVALANAGVAFNIREPFTLTGGPQSALNGLYVQMAQYCPAGWIKGKEWVEPAQAGYFLHYQFQCAGE